MTTFDLSRYQDPLTIQRVIHNARTIAIVGLSRNHLRASYFVGFYLRRHGYRVIPVNPRESEVFGEKSFGRLVDVPVPVDIVNVFRAPDALPGIAREAVAIGATNLWCQFTGDQRGGRRASRRRAVSRSSWIGASRSNTPGTSDGCTGSASTRSASRRCAAGCNRERRATSDEV